MHYELWDSISRNMLADYDTEVEAFADIRDLLEINSPDMFDQLFLVWRDGERGGTVAEGGDLVARARAVGPRSGTLSA